MASRLLRRQVMNVPFEPGVVARRGPPDRALWPIGVGPDAAG